MKEFYFVRHGQTDHNISNVNLKTDHPPETPLNETGRQQALALEPLIAGLPVRSICSSPYKRVQETKEIIAPRLEVPHYDIEELGECTASIWREMVCLGPDVPRAEEGEVAFFLQRVERGLEKALNFEGPVLIVAHGGIHWALCWLLNIKGHKWAVDNCVPIHFCLEEQGNWKARNIN